MMKGFIGQLSIFFFLSLFLGCQKTYTPEMCLDLYTKSYRGHPPSAHDYRYNCQSDELRSHLDCQKVLETLIMGVSQRQLEQTFGPKALDCLTKDDLSRFPLRPDVQPKTP